MKNATHLLMIADRSGSMEAVKHDAQGAINTFLAEQRALDGECHLTFIEFDGGLADYDDWFRVVYEGDIAGSTDYELHPRGFTSLNDAIGKAVVDLGEHFANLPEEDRPSNVIVIIQTDGGENSSKEWTVEKVRDLIDQQQNDYNWSFVYLGMGPDTWNAGVNYGIQNNVRASGTGASYGGTYATASHAVTMSRMSGQSISGLDEDIK